MKIQTKYIVFIGILHLLMVGLSFIILKNNELYFIISEVFILISLVISIQLYKDFINPLKLLMTGIDAIRDKDFNVKFLKTGKFEMDQLIDVYNHMIDQIRDERTLQEQQHYFLEKLIHTSPTGIMILDFEDHIATINAKAYDLLHLTEQDIKGKVIHTIDHPILQAITTLKTGESKMITPHGLQTFKCQKSHFMDRGFPHHFVMIEELTNEILSAEKKAYGKVIRMMAHEVNNSIGAVNSILDVTKTNPQQQLEIRNALQIAIERNDRLNQFMKNFAEVVRIPEPRLETLDINQHIQSIADMMYYKASAHRINFEFEISKTPLLVSADINQMEQVMINIVKNAMESIQQKSEQVSDHNFQATIKFITSFNPGLLIIEDNGVGLSKEATDLLFTPFYSSKRDGQGIGLTVIREILNNHKFKFSLKSIDGITSFKIFFDPHTAI
ncbi:MAG: ATP-binding protein [Saprospiraceae bacterium]